MVKLDDATTWPLQQILPLVRPDGGLWPQLGMLVKGMGPVVCLLPMHEATAKNLRLCDKIAYRSYEALGSDGWRPD